MMKKKKNKQLLVAAVITATIVSGQIAYASSESQSATAVGTIEMSSLIPDNITIEQPMALSEVTLPSSDYGTLAWADDSCVPSKHVQSYDVIFTPYNKSDLSLVSGWDGVSDVIYGSVTVVVSGITDENSSYENNNENNNKEAGNNDGVLNDSTASQDNNEDSDNETTSDNSSESGDSTDENNTQTESTPSLTPSSGSMSEDQKSDNTTSDTEVLQKKSDSTSESDEADSSENQTSIFSETTQNVSEDTRITTIPDELSDEEKAEIAEANHTCDGITVSGTNLPWYVQFRVTSGDEYEFSNETDASVFKSYEFELWDMINDTEYEIPDGEYLSVTVPVDAGYEYTIEHLLDNGAKETIVPSVEGNKMVFSTHSFSPFGIAGNKVLVGEEIEEENYSDNTSDNTEQTSTTVTSTVTPTTDVSSSTTITESAAESTSTSNDSEDEPNTSSTQSDSNENSDTDSTKSKSVSTGDSTPILPFVILGVAAAVIVGALIFIKKRK